MKKKTKNKEVFTASDIVVVCPKKMVWDEMDVIGEGKRLCAGCDKVLVDVTGYTKKEVAELQKKDPSVCVAVTNALIVSTLSLSLLSAGGDIDEQNISIVPLKTEVPIVVYVPPTTMGIPVFHLPKCDEGTVNLNTIKRFFGFDVDDSCREDK